MQEYERKQLLERIGRESATLGVDIPDHIEVQGQEVPLRDVVFELKRRETVPADDQERVEEMKRNLRRERLERKQRIEAGEISYAAGEAEAAAIIGIDRALQGLETLDAEDVQAAADRAEAADTKRWMDFLRQALGRDDDGPEVRGP